MTETTIAHAADGTVGGHGEPGDHGDDHGHDDHAHGGERLGPIDVQVWGAGLFGILLGLAIVLAFVQAAG